VGSVDEGERRLRKVQTGSCTRPFYRVFYKELEERYLQDCRREHVIACVRNKNSSSLKGCGLRIYIVNYLSAEGTGSLGLGCQDQVAPSAPGAP